VDTTETDEARVVEALDAEREPVDASGAVVGEAGRIGRTRIGLEGHLGIGRQRRARGDAVEQATEFPAGHQARRTAANEDAVDLDRRPSRHSRSRSASRAST
jgi:hypothetical protein